MRQRVAALDSLRGASLLGILLLNTGAFALPRAAYLNPLYAGISQADDIVVWLLLAWLVQGKFLAILALILGAGLVSVMQSGPERSYCRLVILALFGIIHALFFWEGDILLSYALVACCCCAIIHVKQTAHRLFVIGSRSYLIGLALLLLFALLAEQQPGPFWLPDADDLAIEKQWKLAGGPAAWLARTDILINVLLSLLLQFGWQLAGLMLMGAALMRSGWLQGAYPRHFYQLCAGWLLLPALFLQGVALWLQYLSNWDYRWSAYYLQLAREIAIPLHALGYISLWFVYWPRLSKQRWIKGIVAVGKMPLSNYLLQTLLCILLFYQWQGYDNYSRLALLLLALLLSVIAVCFSLLWLRFFRQGPMEWCWRKLTHCGVSLWFSVSGKRAG